MDDLCNFRDGMHFKAPKFNIWLIYVKEDCIDAKLYVDPYNFLCIKLETTPSISSPYFMETFQGIQYIGLSGQFSFIMLAFKDMNSLGLVPCARAYKFFLGGTSTATRPNAARET